MDNKDLVLQKVCAYVQAHLDHKITLSDLKQEVQCSARSIQLKFKKYLNQSPFKYIEEQRLLSAYQLIAQCPQSKSVSEVALEVGFKHQGRFSVKFKARFGIHPSSLLKKSLVNRAL